MYSWNSTQRQVAVVEMSKKESMNGFFVHRDKKSSHCREVVVSGGSTVLLDSRSWLDVKVRHNNIFNHLVKMHVPRQEHFAQNLAK